MKMSDLITKFDLNKEIEIEILRLVKNSVRQKRQSSQQFLVTMDKRQNALKRALKYDRDKN